jgi:hypothetical protein
MKINTFNKGMIDTDTLPDAQAELAEETERFKNFICDRNGEGFIWVKVPGNLAWASIDLADVSSVLSTVEALNTGVVKYSNGKLGVMLLPSETIQALAGE